MMTHVEIGAGLARKAWQGARSDDAGAEKMKVISRLFSTEVAQVVSQNILKIVLGCGEFDQTSTTDILAKVEYTRLTDSFHNIIKDMDRLADILFER